MDITERFLNYTKFDTQSAEDSQSVPSTKKQLAFAEYLMKELKAEGLDDVEMDDNGYVYATLKSNVKGEVPTIGFISHYDTSPDCSGKDIKARKVRQVHFPQRPLIHHAVGGHRLVAEEIPRTAQPCRRRPHRHRRSHPARGRRQGRHSRDCAGHVLHARPQGDKARQHTHCVQP